LIDWYNLILRIKGIDTIFRSQTMKKNLRDNSKQTKSRLVLWFFLILFTIGLGLIWVIYGPESALLGLICLLGTLIPVGLIFLFLFGLDKIVKNQD